MSSKQYFDAIITHWVDGDTFNYENIDGSKPKYDSVRIQNIDTPEINHSWAGSAPVDSAEEKWGIKATELAKQLIPEGSHVRLVNSGDNSFNRLVASVFYGNNFEHNFEIEMLKSGLATPIFQANQILSKANIQYYIGLELANSFNYAKDNKKGVWSLESPESVVKVHGFSAPDELEKNPKDPNMVTIYKLWDLRNMKEKKG